MIRRGKLSNHAIILWRTYRAFSRHRGTIYAAALSYFVLFSLFPLLIVIVTVFGWFIRDPALQAQVVDQILDQFPTGIKIRSDIAGFVADLSERSSSLLGIAGLVSTAWIASGMFRVLREGLNAAFDVTHARRLISGRVIDVLGIVAVMSLGLVSAATSATLGILRAQADEVFTGVLVNLVWVAVFILVPFGLSFVAFLLMYRIVPDQTLGWRDLRVAAVIAAVGFEVGKAGFGLFVANVGRFQEVYGALSGVAVFLFFVFLVSNLVLFAASLASELAKEKGIPSWSRS